MPIIAPIPRTERRRMQKTIHKTRGKNHTLRLLALLMLHLGATVSAMSPERSVAHAHRWGDGLIGLRDRELKA